MKDPVRSVPGEHSDSAMQNIGMLFNRKLLAGALVTVLAYAGSFTAYTFIAPILTQVTGVTGATVSLFIVYTGISGAIVSLLGLLLLLAQIRRSHSRKFQQVKIVGQ
ncbi:hypothetical protein ESCOCK434B_04135 [Escherichia coli]|uniref:hypothetical protein n=1 Tax=Escherichia coli TaxID=562 RepID=UPI001CE04A16|nr:hypothetical protein [Escherichia coli]